jgi:hypothetical protein
MVVIQRKRTRIAVLAVLLMMFAATAWFTPRAPAEPPAEPLVLFEDIEPARYVMPVDTPPPPRAAAGWPFEQLPLVAKFDVPLPQLTAATFQPRPVFPDVQPVPVPVAAARVPSAAPGAVSPLWLLPPLAAGAAAGSASGNQVASTIPEPATMILLSTGLAMLGVGAKRRRRDERSDG